MDSIRPEVTLQVNGKSITFLCDTGACRTTCKEPIPHARDSKNSVVVRAASGKIMSVPESEPVWIKDPLGESCQLSILMFPECPVNLLGRDGLLHLGLALIPTTQGQIVVKRKAELQKGDLFVIQGTGEPYYYYSLNIPNTLPQKAATSLLEEGRKVISQPQDVMSEDSLHITLWYKNTPGPERKYEEKLNRATPTKVTTNYLYTDGKATAVAGVSLREGEKSLFRMYTPPHISLYKRKDQTWKEMGKMVQEGERATDWVATSVNTWFSASTGLFKKALFWTVQVQEGIHVYSKQNEL